MTATWHDCFALSADGERTITLATRGRGGFATAGEFLATDPGARDPMSGRSLGAKAVARFGVVAHERLVAKTLRHVSGKAIVHLPADRATA
jgi:hypothetical protein